MERFIAPTVSVQRQATVRYRGRNLTYFGGCDYLRLSVHPLLIEAAKKASDFGLGVAASRRTTGNHPTIAALERELADFFEAESSVLMATGYGMNLALGQALSGRFTHALIDERAHVSLQDATRFLGAEVRPFLHRDPNSLENVYRELPSGARVIVLTDGMFPLEGTVPPLQEYRHRLGDNVWWWLDDCHAVGTLGPKGRGSLENVGWSRHQVLQVITLSKALGSFGGALLADRTTVNQIWERSHCFVGGTPPPLPMVAAARASLRLLKRDSDRIRRLQTSVQWVKQQLVNARLIPEVSPGPMFLISPNSEAAAKRLRRRLLAASIYPSHIHYPGMPGNWAYRFALSSEHSEEELVRLLAAIIGVASNVKGRGSGCGGRMG